MNFKNQIETILFVFLFTTLAFGQTPKPINYLGAVEQISLDKISYDLAWSSYPLENYYKQEYLAKGDTIEKFKKLILLEFIKGEITVKEVVAYKVAELKRDKLSNPIVNYEVYTKKDGEVFMDFLVSENTPDGKSVKIVERNVQRYKSVVDKNGQKGVLLFGVSERAYGNDIHNFFLNLKENKIKLVKLVVDIEIPEIIIPK
jgi:hypothetical protein